MAPIQGWREDLKRRSGRHSRPTNGPRACEKMLNGTKHQGNAHQNHIADTLRMAHDRKTKNKHSRGCGRIGTLTHCWGGYGMVQPHGKQYGGSPQN